MPKSKFVPSVNATVCYCYALLDPRKPGLFRYKTSFGWATFNHEPFYIGKGTSKYRSSTHQWEAVATTNRSRKINKIRKIIKEGLSVIIQHTRGELSEAGSLSLECELIYAIGRLDHSRGPLTNGTDGGDGVCGRVISETTRAKLRAARIGFEHTEETKALMRTRRHSAETKAQMSVSRTGYRHSAEARARMSAAAAGRKNSPEARAKMSEAKRNAPLRRCPHCGKEGRGGPMTTFHFSNCKFFSAIS